MRRTSALLAAVALCAGIAIAAPATPAQAEERTVARGGAVGVLIGGSAGNSAARQQPPVDACQFFWSVDWEVIPVNPLPVTYATGVECGPAVNADIRVQTQLRRALDGGFSELVDMAPEEHVFYADRVESGTTVELARPGSYFLQSDATVTFLPDPTNPAVPPWIWTSLPDGCSGLGTYVADCVIQFPTFNI